MPFATVAKAGAAAGPGADARLVRLDEPRLPGWCDRYLAPPGGDFLAGRGWYDTVLAHAVPAGASPVLALCGAVMLPLLAEGRRLRGLATPYTLRWDPLPAPGTDAAALREAGRSLAGLLRGRPPARLEALDEASPVIDGMSRGLRASGFALDRYRHFGNWWDALAPGGGWAAYLAGRPPALRTTIGRKLARSARESRFTLVTAPGAALHAAIDDYHAVRERSWKPPEPAPGFDAALMQAAAVAGALRLGVLHRASDGRPLAAQYWVVTGGRAFLLKLSHDEAERAASPGTALTALMIRGLIEDDGVTELDFGRGDDPYKQLWVGQRRQRVGLVVTDPWHPAGVLELARQLAGRGRRQVMAWRQAAPAGEARGEQA
ncbi:GNAT family N-acetyltransferase [Pararoseomonas indoligenes]|uniref:GNAT family N-acetyltransferase n=1 Tax=Roseomonas indoligenes TaxID=2820811 RepID=A0A940MZA3_9PROT|nr:GNAT family N-acetyltransferase [Pararoseomonas indoligenes]MBP0496114.1 GNAT family N-acetyltransferase [Pararoseomonas indoligenes]